MLIYIDESGSFAVPPVGKMNYCCLGAVVIPEASSNLFSLKFESAKRRWFPAGVEMKGSALSEKRVAHVIELADNAGIKFFTCGTEMSHYTDAELGLYRDTQADKLVASLTPEHTASLLAQMNTLRDTMKGMPPQLFVQFMLLTELVARVIRASLMHFSLLGPRELGAFHWTIDGKDKTRTEYERLWEMLSGGLLQSQFLSDPPFGVAGADSSEFDAAFSHQNQKWPEHLPQVHPEKGAQNGRIIDLRKLLSASRKFGDSKQTVGLQVADILTNAYRRALRGNLQPEGWGNLGKLMLKATTESAVGWMHFSKKMDNQPVPEALAPILSRIESQARFAFEPGLRGIGIVNRQRRPRVVLSELAHIGSSRTTRRPTPPMRQAEP